MLALRFSKSLASTFARTFALASPITLTEMAARKAIELQEQGDGNNRLRIEIEAGGCSGFNYVFNITHELQEDDDVYKQEFGGKTAEVVVDETSFIFVNGCIIDYVDEMIKTGFVIKENPNASDSCGCGTSFSADF
eukprot:TRINITY_DN782176_c0_g1_i1.p1 TRINITY_DN782176_c0_g1~~TRINITY_DN782176_c0_g1_i1.p1  ORF type:complete len:136 (-),score=35.33 TRINITY_DN782176_c0_g1_i1:263-670(-)